MIAHDLHTAVTGLRRSILTMGAAVETHVEASLGAFLAGDARAAEEAIRRDREIDEMDVRVEAQCVDVLARFHPVARDLRFVLAVLRIDNDLERAADLAKGVAKRTLQRDDNRLVERPAALSLMVDHAQAMLSDAIRAIADNDPELARKVRASDQIVDDLQRRIYQWATEEIPEHTERTSGAINILSVTRAVERIADLATNIGEDVVYMIEGEVVRHSRV